MKKGLYITVVVLITLAITLLLGASAFAGSPEHNVTGGGAFVLPGFGEESYAFNVKMDAAGRVWGQGQFTFAIPYGSFHVRMTCLAVSGNTAWMGMTITKTRNSLAYPVGLNLMWSVRDNGEGEASPYDQESYFFTDTTLPLYFPGTTDCLDMPDLLGFEAFDWLEGNVQVR